MKISEALYVWEGTDLPPCRVQFPGIPWLRKGVLLSSLVMLLNSFRGEEMAIRHNSQAHIERGEAVQHPLHMPFYESW